MPEGAGCVKPALLRFSLRDDQVLVGGEDREIAQHVSAPLVVDATILGSHVVRVLHAVEKRALVGPRTILGDDLGREPIGEPVQLVDEIECAGFLVEIPGFGVEILTGETEVNEQHADCAVSAIVGEVYTLSRVVVVARETAVGVVPVDEIENILSLEPVHVFSVR